MAFTILKTDGTPITVSLTQDNTYSLRLTGTGSLIYPQDIAQNFIRHLENFANSSSPPGTHLRGQIWYDTTASVLKVYNGSSWTAVGGGVITTTDDLTEGSMNLYHTPTRVRTSISVSGDLNYNSVTGVISYTTPAAYTDADARAAISANGDLSYNPATGVMSFTATPLYTDANARAAISVTGNLTYNANTGVIGYVDPAPYTDANARAAISTTGDLNYDQSNGIISFTMPAVDPYDQSLIIACSDEVTPITTGLVATMRVPMAMVLTEVRASLTNAQTSGNVVTVDIKQNNTSILSTLITIDNNEKTSLSANVQPVISSTGLVDDAELTVYVTDVGNATVATGLKVVMTGYTGSAGYLVGYTGSIGFTGSRGFTGYDGSIGALGFTGSQGTGFTGSQGDVGFTGSGGLGYTGSVGPSGPAGSVTPFFIVTATTQNAAVNSHYALTNVGATAVTLPSGPTLGDQVTVTVANGRLDNTVLRNGSNIMAQADNLTLNIANSTTRLRYINSSLGWWIV